MPQHNLHRVWRVHIRPLIMARDQYRCRICQVTSLSLHVHHMDGNQRNNEPANLISLCRSCHNRAHGRAVIVCQTASSQSLFEHCYFNGLVHRVLTLAEGHNQHCNGGARDKRMAR